MNVSPATSSALLKELAWAKKHLPHQGTLQHFVHHNPLEALEDFSFEKACDIAAVLYEGECFMEQAFYLQLLREGKIQPLQLKNSLSQLFATDDPEPDFEEKMLAFLSDPPPPLGGIFIQKKVAEKA